MSPFSCSCNAHLSPQVTRSWINLLNFSFSRTKQQPPLAFRSLDTEIYGQRVVHISSRHGSRWSFVADQEMVSSQGLQESIVTEKDALYQLTAYLQCEIQESTRGIRPKRNNPSRNGLTSSQIAANTFTWGTVAVLPFYTLMVLAPHARLTKRTMESCIPYVVLGVLYAYLLYLSWSPDTFRLMFASKYWLPELHGIARMFSNEMTVSSAWIHLLAVDLFAARQVFHDGIRNKIETRHSVSLCLLFCPIGIVIHEITKLLNRREAPSH